MSTPVPAAPYDRTLLNQVRLGKGKGLKKLKDSLSADPKLAQNFFKDRRIEIENGKQKEKMMWVKDANSRVRRVESDQRAMMTFTNPMGAHRVPDRTVVERCAAAARSTNKVSACNGMSLFN